MFGSVEEPTALASQVRHSYIASHYKPGYTDIKGCQILGQKSKTVDLSAKQTSAPSKLSRIKLTDAEKKKLQERIRNATSLQEIIALEKELNEGRIPSGLHADAMEE